MMHCTQNDRIGPAAHGSARFLELHPSGDRPPPSAVSANETAGNAGEKRYDHAKMHGGTQILCARSRLGHPRRRMPVGAAALRVAAGSQVRQWVFNVTWADIGADRVGACLILFKNEPHATRASRSAPACRLCLISGGMSPLHIRLEHQVKSLIAPPDAGARPSLHAAGNPARQRSSKLDAAARQVCHADGVQN